MTKPPCLHKQANHQCGTNARARLDGCRCDPCLAARRAYDRKRAKWTGDYPYVDPPRVPAEPVRAHILSLMGQGMGPKRVAEVSGVPHGAISKLVYGTYRAGRPPSKTVNRATAQKLFATELDLADGAKVDAAEAWQIVDELLARGWWKTEIGRRMTGPAARSLQLSTNEVFAGTLRTLRKLLDEPVPDRVHSTGKTYSPATDHTWRNIPADTPGVPERFDSFEPHSPEWLAVMRKGLWEAVEQAKQKTAFRFVA